MGSTVVEAVVRWSVEISGFVVCMEVIPIDGDVGMVVGVWGIEGDIVVDVGIGVAIS